LSKFNNGSHLDRLKEKVVEIVKLPFLIPACLPKNVLEKSKFFRKGKKSKIVINTNARKSYTQGTSSNVSNILKLKENYPSLLVKRIEDIYRIISNMDKNKPCIKMTIMAFLANHVTNINRALKIIKSEVIVDYIHPETIEVTIISNPIASQSDFQVMERYIKNIENVMSDNIQIPRLPQLKKSIIKASYIFNDLILISKPRIIKASPKSDITVI